MIWRELVAISCGACDITLDNVCSQPSCLQEEALHRDQSSINLSVSSHLQLTHSFSYTFGPDFTRTWGSSGWFCNICTADDAPRINSMTVREAMLHELTPEHARNVSDHDTWHSPADYTGWETSGEQLLTAEGLKVREKQTRVDHVRHMVPWWVRAVEAAGRGEEMRMEEFLDTINKSDGWGPDGMIWGDEWGVVPDAVNGNDWANGTWGEAGGGGEWSKPVVDWAMSGSASSLHARRTPTASSLGPRRRHNPKRKGKTRDVDTDGRHYDSYKFVEEIAKQGAVDAERKRRMHKFFEVRTVFV
jgi:hypothetical protein